MTEGNPTMIGAVDGAGASTPAEVGSWDEQTVAPETGEPSMGSQHAEDSGTASQAATQTSRGQRRQLSVLLYSDDSSTRDAVRLAVGRRPARDLEISSWYECATPAAVFGAVANGGFDLLVLDGEAAKVGGMGITRELKNSVYDCPPCLVLTGRVQDAWLATWSQADAVVPHPLDPGALVRAVVHLARSGAAATRAY